MREFVINCPVCNTWVSTIHYSGKRDMEPEWKTYTCKNRHKFLVSNTRFDFSVHELKHFINDIEIDPNNLRGEYNEKW